MKIETDYINECTLTEFADRHKLVMKITERGVDRPSHAKRFYAQFKGSEVKERGMLTGIYGDGDTPEEAMADYFPRISEKLLAFDAFTDERREVLVPRLTGV